MLNDFGKDHFCEVTSGSILELGNFFLHDLNEITALFQSHFSG